MVWDASFIRVFLIMSLFFCFTAQASALVQETTYLGRVTAMDPLSLTLTIRAESEYGCDYSGGNPSCSFKQITPLQVIGTVPDEGVYNTFHNGDLVAGTILGGTGGRWAGIALVIQPPGSSAYVTSDIYGDPRTIPVPLGGDYGFDYSTLPDCSQCSGSVCRALSAHVVVRSGDTVVLEQSLNNGQSTRYSGRNDGSEISILYLSGEASSSSCPGTAPVAGIQPVSNFVIHVKPPIGGFTAPRETMPAKTESGGGEKPEGTPVPEKTQAPGLWITPLVSIGAIVFLVWTCRKNEEVMGQRRC